MEPPAATVIFEVAGNLCGIPAAAVEEIVLVPALLRLPGQPPVLEGFINLRGSAVPVVKLDRLFHLESRPPELHMPLIIVTGGEGAVALAVDRVQDVAHIPKTDLRPLENGHSFNDCAIAEFDFGRRAGALLESGRILLQKERQCLAELRERMQAELDSLAAPTA